MPSVEPCAGTGAADIAPARPGLQQLLVQVRRATQSDQPAVLDWLRTKFPSA
jgi:hypothetical protein